jgi:holo-[acyl-carrier protein] synthase
MLMQETADHLNRRFQAFHQHLAVRFAAKEAVFKALGTGLSGGLHWIDAEVRNEPSGKPYLILSGPAKALADQLGVHTILVSLSHSRQYAIAQVMLLGRCTLE